jgi:mRNA interferase RelE/StbE
VKKLAFSKEALRTLRRMPPNMASIIRGKIDQYGKDPAALANNVLKLSGRGGFRLRVGDWRVIFEEDEAEVRILAIGPRGGVYD